MSLKCKLDDEIEQFLKAHPDWTKHNQALSRQLQFNDFIQAFDFMTQVANIADAHDHHPQWSNCYNKVNIEITTHEAGGITQRDFVFIEAVDQLL